MIKRSIKLCFLAVVATLSAQNNTSLTKPTIEWVDIPAGTFIMGSYKEEPFRKNDETTHEVKVSAFKMSKYEITYDQLAVFLKADHREPYPDYGFGKENRPVVGVTWNDAKAFAEWMGCRLPTESEWEYACRAGSSKPFYTRNCLSDEQAIYNWQSVYGNCENKIYTPNKKTQTVGSLPPNAWGLYDMHGNAREWCSDWYAEYPTAPQVNPKGPETGLYHVIRGGSWKNDAQYCRSAYRSFDEPQSRNDGMTGFRLVLGK